MSVLYDRYRLTLRRLRAVTVAHVARTWDTLGDYDDEPRFVDQVVPVVTHAQHGAVALADAHIAMQVTVGTGRPAAPVGLDADTIAGQARGGVPAVEVYRRPFKALRVTLADGADWEDAVGIAGRRVMTAAATDIALAARAASSAAMAGHGIVGYRRVLSGGSSCRLCLEASTQRYRVEELMPIHPHCDCTTTPIFGERDPDHVLDPELVKRVKDLERDGQRLRVIEHPELGPTLTSA